MPYHTDFVERLDEHGLYERRGLIDMRVVDLEYIRYKEDSFRSTVDATRAFSAFIVLPIVVGVALALLIGWNGLSLVLIAVPGLPAMAIPAGLAFFWIKYLIGRSDQRNRGLQVLGVLENGDWIIGPRQGMVENKSLSSAGGEMVAGLKSMANERAGDSDAAKRPR